MNINIDKMYEALCLVKGQCSNICRKPEAIQENSLPRIQELDYVIQLWSSTASTKALSEH